MAEQSYVILQYISLCVKDKSLKMATSAVEWQLLIIRSQCLVVML